ncbi:MAG: hypothetical protein ACLFV8_06050 [Alphaproteobacteria bacterium]
MEQNAEAAPSGYSALKDKQRAVRDGFPDAFGLRIHRAISWLGRAEQEAEDDDVRFILLWVGFNAAYGGDVGAEITGERSAFKRYLDTLAALDRSGRLHNAVWERFPHEIRLVLDNKYLFGPFWNHVNGVDGYESWAEWFEGSRRRAAAAMRGRETTRMLFILFDRLYVLRNQLMHGSATWNSSANRAQVRDGSAVMSWLLPVFLDIMMDNPHRDWGRPFCPVVA